MVYDSLTPSLFFFFLLCPLSKTS